MNWTTIFFDLDGTLYPNENQMWLDIRDRITLYMSEQLGFSSEEIRILRDKYLHLYGTTLRGLQLHHKVDVYDFLAYVHDVPLEKYLSPDKYLRELLISLPQQKWIFTNADKPHASRVLKTLNVEDCFDGIIDIHDMEFLCKPHEEAYHKAMTITDSKNPHQCVLIDDLARNLEPAKVMGFSTVLITEGRDIEIGDHHIQIETIHDLKNGFPALWE